MSEERCRSGGPTKANGNCTNAGPDGFAVQCVGPWALLDPFAIEALDFEVIRKLAAFQRMDLLVHFPTGDIRRNLLQGAKERLRRAMGRDTNVTRAPDVPKAIEELRAELARLGYTGEAVRSVAVKHKGLTLYHLMFASKDERGDAIWQSISKTLASGQRRLF